MWDRAQRTRHRSLWLAAALLLMSCSVLLSRSLPARDLVLARSGEVRLLGNDAFYHLRHARHAAANFPHLQRWDVGTHYPHGQRSSNAGLYDLGVAACALLLGSDVERVMAWTPAVLGAIAIPVLYLLARSFLGPGGALFACLLLVLYPASWFDRTRLGFADHHALEVLLALLSALALTRVLATAGSRWRASWLAAVPLALFVFTWPGAPLWVFGVALAMLVHLCAAVIGGADPRPGARACTRLALGLLACIGLPAWLLPDSVLEPRVLPALLAGLAALALGPFVLVAGIRAGRRARLADAWIGLAPLALAIGAAWLLAESTQAGGKLAGHLLGRKTIVVAEHVHVDWRLFAHQLGLPGILAIVACPLALARARRGEAERRAVAPLVLTSLLLFLWWSTGDYGYALSPFVALAAAYVLGLPQRALAGRRGARAAFGLAIALALALPIWPLRWVRSPVPPAEERLVVVGDAWREALAWMREHTPPPSLPPDARVDAWGAEGFAYPSGTYGVMVPWEYGNAVGALAGRAPVWSQGPSLSNALWLLDVGPESGTVENLCRGCRGSEEVRYVVLDAATLADHFPALMRTAHAPAGLYVAPAGAGRDSATFGERYLGSIAARLYLADGNGLSHYRLVYETTERSELVYESQRSAEGLRIWREAVAATDGRRRSSDPVRTLRDSGETHATVKIFEVVRGARLVGTTAPRASLTAELELRSETTQRTWIHRIHQEADENGSFRLVLAHPTHGAGGPVRALAAWRVTSPAARVEVEISEDEVRQGAQIAFDPARGRR